MVHEHGACGLCATCCDATWHHRAEAAEKSAAAMREALESLLGPDEARKCVGVGTDAGKDYVRRGEETAAIVKWLRSGGVHSHLATAEYIAFAIERGEHLK